MDDPSLNFWEKGKEESIGVLSTDFQSFCTLKCLSRRTTELRQGAVSRYILPIDLITWDPSSASWNYKFPEVEASLIFCVIQKVLEFKTLWEGDATELGTALDPEAKPVATAASMQGGSWNCHKVV